MTISSSSPLKFFSKLGVHEVVNFLSALHVQCTIPPSSPELGKARAFLRPILSIDKLDVMFGKSLWNSLLLTVQNFVVILNEVCHAEHILAIPGVLNSTVSELFVHSRVEVANQEM